MLSAAFCAADMNPSNALRACSTLCSAKVRISRGTSKFPVACLAIGGSLVYGAEPQCGGWKPRLLRLQIDKKHRQRTLHIAGLFFAAASGRIERNRDIKVTPGWSGAGRAAA